jgi:hypothetical protein
MSICRYFHLIVSTRQDITVSDPFYFAGYIVGLLQILQMLLLCY